MKENRLQYSILKTALESNSLLSLDETLRINHEDCPAGRDIKRRLYITRKKDGHIAYCHNCGCSGSVMGGSRNNKLSGTAQSSAKSRSLSYHSNFLRDGKIEPKTRDWTSETRSWVYRYGITDSELASYGIGYSEYTNSVVFPLDTGVISASNGYVRRNFNKDVPKYIMYNPNDASWLSKNYKGNHLVICEDILSGIKCARTIPTMALLKTTLSLVNKAHIVQGLSSGEIQKVLVFLDMDSPSVRRHAINIYNTLSLYSKSIYILDKYIKLDPKEIDSNILHDYLSTYL
jgi:hypothetical protein